MKVRTLTLAALGLALAGCATTPINPTTAGPYPDDYKALVAEYVRHAFKDPSSVRDAAISDPAPGRTFAGIGWFTCLRANAKNSYGGYTGEETRALLIRDGQVVDDVDGALGGLCQGRRVYPFPEIEAQR
jgi:hypothetical protein